MALWFVFALMTAAAIFAVLWPLGRPKRAQSEGSEATVYKDQLKEIDRDLAAGFIGTTEADAARVEIGRRLLAAADTENKPPMQSNLRGRRAAAAVALLGLPIVGMSLYLPLGSPLLPDFPLTARNHAPDVKQPLDALVAQVEQHLERNPNDGRGWAVLAPVLERLGRNDDAVRAFRNSITYNGESSDRRADLGEAMTASAGGVVTAEAKVEFERALALNADDPKASYFLGLAAEQDGHKEEAATIWRSLLTRAPADAPWRSLVATSLARVSGTAPSMLSDEMMSAAKDMSEADRTAMIHGMVERLATRLKQNGEDVDGWLRLIRAYVVMGDREKAKSAVSDARQAVANDAERLTHLNEGLRNLGLDG